MSVNYNHYAQALPFTSYYILAVLANRPLHVYALREQIINDSDSAVIPARSSLDNALKRLESWGFIEKDTLANIADTRRGATYAITATGKRRLEREITHLETAVRAGNLGLSATSLLQ